MADDFKRNFTGTAGHQDGTWENKAGYQINEACGQYARSAGFCYDSSLLRGVSKRAPEKIFDAPAFREVRTNDSNCKHCNLIGRHCNKCRCISLHPQDLARMCDLCEDRKETGMEESRKYVKVEMDMSELDDVLKKVEKLREVLLEAKTLLDELASKEIDLRIKL